MTGESPPDSDWVVAPEPREVRLAIAMGDEVELSETQRGAVEALIEAFHAEDEVSGFLRIPSCSPLTTCAPKTVTMPCASFVVGCNLATCKITYD